RALDELRKAAGADRQGVADAAWRALTSMDGRVNPGACIQLLILLNEAPGVRQTENLLLTRWRELGETARTNLCYGAFDPRALSTDLAAKLFDSTYSGVGERHLIAA